MHKIEFSLLILLGLWLTSAGFPLWLGICVAAPAIFLTPEGGEKDGRKNLHRKRNRRM